jgi:transmembrane sensor
MDPNLPNDEVASAIVRVLSGDLPEREEIELRRWLDADPERHQLFEEIRAVWDEAGIVSSAPDSWDTRALRKRIIASRDVNRRSAKRSPPLPRLASRHWREVNWIKAAAVLLVIGGAALVRFGIPSPFRGQPTSRAPMREVVTTRGEQATLDLVDGTRVILAADSKLRIPVDYREHSRSGSRRELDLEGKAYFKVLHDSARPFIVRTATAVTEDLGTEFVVEAYPESRATQVVVASGAVTFGRSLMTDRAMTRSRDTRSAQEPVLHLTRGSLGRMDSEGTATFARNIHVDEHLSWTKGILVFRSTPLDEAVLELNRWYDVDIRLATTALARRRITAELRNEPFEVALRRLTMTLGVDARRGDGAITLVPR